MEYWRARLDDIVDTWFRGILGLWGGSVALFAIAGNVGISQSATAFLFGFLMFLGYLNQTSATGWAARRNLEVLEEAWPAGEDKAWPDHSEVRPYSRIVPGAWPIALISILLLVPFFVIAVMQLPSVWASDEFWQAIGVQKAPVSAR
jgi:hypothetical protein